MKTSHCDECQNKGDLGQPGIPDFNNIVRKCAKGHKPRWFVPRSPIDTDYEQAGGENDATKV